MDPFLGFALSGDCRWCHDYEFDLWIVTVILSVFDLVLLDVCVYLRLLCLFFSMITLVFLQVLEPFCPLSEQENVEPEEVEVNQPTCSTNVFITSKTDINSTSLSSDSNHKDQSCNASLRKTDCVSSSLTNVALPAFLDAESAPPPLSYCTSASQPCLVSVPPLSNGPSDPHSKALLVADDSCIPPPSQSEPLNCHPCVDMTITPLSEIISECYCSPIKIVTSDGCLQKNDLCSLPVPNSASDSLV